MEKKVTVSTQSAGGNQIRPSQRQFKMMLDHMETHPRMIVGKVDTIFTPAERRERWEELATILNEDWCGATKNADKWRKTWSDWKGSVKTKAKARQNYTGDGPKPRLSDLEERLLKIICWENQESSTDELQKTQQDQQQNLLLLGGGLDNGASSDVPLISSNGLPIIKTEKEDVSDDNNSNVSRAPVVDTAAAAAQFLLSNLVPSSEISTQTEFEPRLETRKRKHDQDHEQEDISMKKAIACFIDLQEQRLEVLKQQSEQTARLASAAERFAAAFEKIAEKL